MATPGWLWEETSTSHLTASTGNPQEDGVIQDRVRLQILLLLRRALLSLSPEGEAFTFMRCPEESTGLGGARCQSSAGAFLDVAQAFWDLGLLI